MYWHVQTALFLVQDTTNKSGCCIPNINMQVSPEKPQNDLVSCKQVRVSAVLPVQSEGSVSCCAFSGHSQLVAVTFSLSDTTYIFPLLGTQLYLVLRHSGTLPQGGSLLY